MLSLAMVTSMLLAAAPAHVVLGNRGPHFPAGTTEVLQTELWGAERSNIEFRVENPEPTEANVTIHCTGGCGFTYRDTMGGYPQGAFLIGPYDQGRSENIATLWMGASRLLVAIYHVTPHGVEKLIDEPTNGIPSFTADAQDRTQVIVPEDADVGVGEKHPKFETVFTWTGKGFTRTRRPWRAHGAPR